MDRIFIGIAVIGAAVFLESLDPQRVSGYLAGVAGLFAVHERLRREFSPAISGFTVILLFAATPLFWAMTRAASPLEPLTFAFVAIAWLVLGTLQKRSARIAVWVTMAAIPLLLRFASDALSASPAPAASLSAIDALYSPSHGLFSLTPVVYFAAVGMCFFARVKLTEAALTFGILLIWITASPWPPRATDDEPFGHGLTSVLVLLAPGLAFAIDYATRKPLVAVAPLVVGAIVWNYWLMVQYTAGMLPKDAPVSFGAMVRQQADVHTRAPYTYPFAVPANLWFAWREGVPPDRYDVLSRVPRHGEFELALDRAADPFVLEGFGAIGSTPSGPVRWTTGRRATIAIPLHPAADSPFTVDVIALARGDEPPVAVDVAIEINGHEIGQFVALPAREAVHRLTIPAAAVGRVLRAGYNRLTIVNRGSQRIGAPEQPAPGPLTARSVPHPIGISKIRIAPVS